MRRVWAGLAGRGVKGRGWDLGKPQRVNICQLILQMEFLKGESVCFRDLRFCREFTRGIGTRGQSLKGCSLNHYFHGSALGISPFPPLDSAGKEIQCSQACLIKTALQLPLLQGLSTLRVAHLNLKHLCCLPPSLRSPVCSSAWLTFVKLTAELLGRANTALQIY